ncbi:MAG TPA: (Fe-S)-binding protein [Gemmatimonadales bacterium]|nr:(Fe-S)-binding protein [Gemmatimonadales bacterium]
MATEAGAARGFRALDSCVHCGFCLPACPTYLATGDEADSPRGRIVLMRALERGELPDDDPALNEHLDACLGCRGCEPVCPAGVGYGEGLEAARTRLAAKRGLPLKARLVLAMFRHEWLWRPLFTALRWLRNAGMARGLAGSSRIGFGMGMIAATRGPMHPQGAASRIHASGLGTVPSVALFTGCVMDGLFRHVHEATRRTLEANGYQVKEVAGQVCCGALHAHAGDHAGAAALARLNVKALANSADFIVINSAGCGALLKEYGHLLGEPAAAEVAARVRDVTELLAARGPRQGGRLELEVAYDSPCHLQHAQHVLAQPLAVLSAIPGLNHRMLPGADRCCGSAGIYSLLQPGLSREVLRDKLETLATAAPRPAIVVTGNPGCLMQIGAGLIAEGLAIEVRHPVELLDESYRRGGFYGEL